jgi:hypothetical protein
VPCHLGGGTGNCAGKGVAGMGRSEKTTRARARMVECPRCGAVAGQMCRGAKGKRRASAHAERHRAYLKLAATAIARRVDDR